MHRTLPLVPTLALALTLSSLAAEPERLTQLRGSWQQARQKATDPIDLKYRQELQKMLDTLTKAGDLNGALAVKAELDALAPSATEAPKLPVGAKPSRPPRSLKSFDTAEAYQEWLLTTEWISKDGKTHYTFPEPGKMKMTTDDPAATKEWVVDMSFIGEVRWKYSSGRETRMVINPSLDDGRYTDGSPLTRKKP